LEEADLDVEGFVLIGYGDALGLQAEVLLWVWRFGIDPRVKRSKVPTLAIFPAVGL
jgi:hypothetical protein